jgi:hypothetical protein
MIVASMGIDTSHRRLPQTILFCIATFVVLPVILAIFPIMTKSVVEGLRQQPARAVFAQKTYARLAEIVGENNTPFLTDIRASSYASWKYPRLYPFIDTGFNRFEQDSVRYYHYIFTSPEALRFSLANLDVDYVVISFWNRHWIFLMEQIDDWELFYVEQDGAVYVRTSKKPEGVEPPDTDKVDFPLLTILKKKPENRIQVLEKMDFDRWTNPAIYSYCVHWLRSLPEDLRKNYFKKLAAHKKAPHPIIIPVAMSLNRYDIAEKYLRALRRKISEDMYKPLMVQLLIAQNKIDEAKKYEPFLNDRASMSYQEARAQYTDVDPKYYWNPKTREFMQNYHGKLNYRIFHKIRFPITSS